MAPHVNSTNIVGVSVNTGHSQVVSLFVAQPSLKEGCLFLAIGLLSVNWVNVQVVAFVLIRTLR